MPNAADLVAQIRSNLEPLKEKNRDHPYLSALEAGAEKIYAPFEDGSMPCDEPWPEDRLALFKRWMEEGMAP